MIVSFSVANFRSFAAEETFSLVASHRFPGSHEDHAVTIPGSKEQVLHTAVIYGANGAGKSNLFKALKYVEEIALEPRKKNSGTGREAFRLGEMPEEVSSFDLQFIVNEKLYRFGFKANDVRITEEWLVQVNGKREKAIYERVTDEKGKVTVEGPGFEKVSTKLAALATVGGPPNQSFLATIQATLDAEDAGKELRSILKWFQHELRLIEPDQPIAPVGHLATKDSNFLNFAGAFLKLSSIGVENLRAQKIEMSESDLRSLLPERLVIKMLEELATDPNCKTLIFDAPGDGEIVIERSDENHFYRITIQAAHQHRDGTEILFDLTDESDGTLRLLNLIPALYHLQSKSGVYFIDEIDRSMHPMLVWKFIEFFLKSCVGARRQVIVTTHESNLLDLDLLRRDEIWFPEKDTTGATRIYSLADYKVRKDLEVRKHYLNGRFGAVPFLGDLDRLQAE
jgi:AAA15 family ATPase/GTPase